MSYIEDIAEAVFRKANPDRLMNDEERALYLIYATLVLAVGTNTSLRDVHDAWSAWKAMSDPEHASLKPFDQLPQHIQEADRPYADAIRRVAEELGG